MNYKELIIRMIKNPRIRLVLLGFGIVLIVIAITIGFALSNNSNGEVIIPDSNVRHDNNLNSLVNRATSGDAINSPDKIPEYDYTEALDHIGERAIVKGTVVKVFTSKSGVTFLDFCEDFSDCPFSAIIFASDLKKFKDVSKLERAVEITGTIKSYQGKAEIIINNPEQIK